MDDELVTAHRDDIVVLPASAFVPGRRDAPLSERVIAAVKRNQAASKSKNTLKAYESDWAGFERWCDANGRVSLPASGETVAAYLSDRADDRTTAGAYVYAPSTLTRWLTAINVRHHAAGELAPGTLFEVQSALDGIRREHARPTRRMAPLLLTDLKLALDRVDMNSYPQGLIGHRDAALLVMGFAGAFRRSELAALTVGNVVRHSEEGLRVRVTKSKTDQTSQGRIKALPYGSNPLTCPPCTFLRWVRVLDAVTNQGRPATMRLLDRSDPSDHICRGPADEMKRLEKDSPLFRSFRRGGHLQSSAISGDVVNDVVKRRLAAVGLDPTNFGGHSLRAGFVTQAMRQGSRPEEIMRQTDHKSLAMLEVYRRENDPLRGNAVTGLGL